MLWSPAFFGVKPATVIKGGMIAIAPMGDINASIPTPQPVHCLPDVRRAGQRSPSLPLTFLPQAAVDSGVQAAAAMNSRTSVRRW